MSQEPLPIAIRFAGTSWRSRQRAPQRRVRRVGVAVDAGQRLRRRPRPRRGAAGTATRWRPAARPAPRARSRRRRDRRGCGGCARRTPWAMEGRLSRAPQQHRVVVDAEQELAVGGAARAGRRPTPRAATPARGGGRARTARGDALRRASVGRLARGRSRVSQLDPRERVDELERRAPGDGAAACGRSCRRPSPSSRSCVSANACTSLRVQPTSDVLKTIVSKSLCESSRCPPGHAAPRGDLGQERVGATAAPRATSRQAAAPSVASSNGKRLVEVRDDRSAPVGSGGQRGVELGRRGARPRSAPVRARTARAARAASARRRTRGRRPAAAGPRERRREPPMPLGRPCAHCAPSRSSRSARASPR